MLSVNSSIDNAMSNAPHMITLEIFQLARLPCQHRLTLCGGEGGAAQCETVMATTGGLPGNSPCNHIGALVMALSMEEFTDNIVPPPEAVEFK